MSAMYTSQNVMTLYNISSETVRNYVREFNQYFSPTATPQKGKTRQFTEDDMRVFSLITEMKGEGHTYNDIHASLASGSRGQTPVLEPEEISKMVSANQDLRLAIQVEHLQLALQKLTEERDEALARAAEAERLKMENVKLQTQMENLTERVDELNRRVEDYQQQIGNLYKQIGRLEGKLEE